MKELSKLEKAYWQILSDMHLGIKPYVVDIDSKTSVKISYYENEEGNWFVDGYYEFDKGDNHRYHKTQAVEIF